MSEENTQIEGEINEVQEESQEIVEEVAQEEEVAEESSQEELAAEEVKRIKKLMLKVDGEELEEELPFEIEEAHADYLKKQLQLAKAAQKRMQESAQIRKEQENYIKDMQAFLLALKEDPASILSDERIGVDLKEFATNILNQQLEEEAKDPQQKELERLQKEKEEYARKLQAIQEQKEAEERARLQTVIANQITDEITDAIEKHGLPKDELVISRFLDAYKTANRHGIKLNASEVAPLLKKQMYEEAKKYASFLSEDDLEDFIGQEKITNAHKRLLGKLKPKTVPSVKEVKDTGSNYDNIFEKKGKEKLSSREFFKQLERKYK